MTFWFSRNKPRVEILLEALIDEITVLRKSTEKFIRKSGLIAKDVAQSGDSLDQIADAMHRGPFGALKKWIDECTITERKFSDQRREFISREKMLLDRWKAHVSRLEERITSLEEERMAANSSC